MDELKILEGKIVTEAGFSSAVEEKAFRQGLSYMDAIINVCEETEFPIENVGKVLSPSLKEKLETEAAQLKLIKNLPEKLPI